MLFIISVILQTLVVFLVVGVIYKIFWTIVDCIRMFIYYQLGKEDIFTTEEKIAYGIIEPNTVDHTVEVLNSDDMSHDEFWDKMNTKLDLQFEQSKYNPDEIIFKGRVKRRR